MILKSYQIGLPIFVNLLATLVRGQQEIYGDIYPNTRAELNLYYSAQQREIKCYKDVP